MGVLSLVFSVLDRGRALKPLAGENVGKFGGYLHR